MLGRIKRIIGKTPLESIFRANAEISIDLLIPQSMMGVEGLNF